MYVLIPHVTLSEECFPRVTTGKHFSFMSQLIMGPTETNLIGRESFARVNIFTCSRLTKHALFEK